MYLAIYVNTDNGLFMGSKHTENNDPQTVADELAAEYNEYPTRIILVEVNDNIPVAAADWEIDDDYTDANNPTVVKELMLKLGQDFLDDGPMKDAWNKVWEQAPT